MYKKPKASITCEVYGNKTIVSVNGNVNDLIAMLVEVIECAAKQEPSFAPIALSCINKYFNEKGKNKTS